MGQGTLGARAALLAVAFASAAWGAEMARTEAAGLRFAVPKTWTRVPAPSDMRAAQYKLPRAGSDAEDAELTLFFFGEGKGGGAEQNLERWYGQFTEPDGRPSRDAAVVTKRTVNGLRLTAVDLAGTYVGSPMGGPPSAGAKPGYRLLAAVVEGDGGPWFFKVVGSAATVAQAKDGFDALLLSLEPHR